MQNKTNQYDEQGLAYGYWENASAPYYYKCYYVNGEVFGYYEHHFSLDKGITYEYHAK
jgi:hypothetical protein